MVVGPVGQGKSTTLSTMINMINKDRAAHIVTIEDPIEFIYEPDKSIIDQREVGDDTTDFSVALKSVFREDVNVIFIGEMRSPETIAAAVTAAETGHLVFSTIHTNDAAGSITRLVDMGVEPFLVSSSLVAAMAQRLVRRLCPSCKEAYKPNPQELQELGANPELMNKKTIYRAKGCSECAKTGYQGRMAIYEIMPIDEKIRGMILKNTDSSTIKKAATDAGVKTLREDGANKIMQGLTTIEEVLRVTQDDMLV